MSDGQLKVRAKRSEVARIAGVSEATVSFVFSKKRYVSDELRNRVLEVAKQLDYQPDYIARSMVTKTTETIAVLTSDMASPLQMEVIKAIQKEALEKGFYVYVCGGTKHLEKYVDNFIARRVDGVFVSVVSSFVNDNYIKKMLDKGISVIVNSARIIDDDRICGLELDFAYAMELAVKHLKSLGHTKIAYLSCFDTFYEADKRINGFVKAMNTELGDGNPTIIMGKPPYDSTIEIGIELVHKLMEQDKQFTAIVCTNDLMAMGAISGLRQRGYKIPEDISVVGIDDILFAKAYDPPLTTISHSSKVYGEKLFEILYNNIIQKTVTHDIVLPELIIRQSTSIMKPRLNKN